MTLRESIAVESILDCIAADHEAGKLIWKTRPVRFFPGKYPVRDSLVWNQRYAGRPALITVNEHGYLYGSFLGSKLRAHRVMWAIANGKWPEGEIDHINGVTTDNRLSNLRDVTGPQNRKNCSVRKDSKSGCPGVVWYARHQKWLAQISSDGKTHNIGYFASLDDAIAARKSAEITFGFHANHGRPSANATVRRMAATAREALK